MRFTWDPKKAALNKKKHGVSFEAATAVFADPNYVAVEDIYDENGEQRHQVIGLAADIVCLLVVCIFRDEENAIHLISARKADARETEIYNQATFGN